MFSVIFKNYRCRTSKETEQQKSVCFHKIEYDFIHNLNKAYLCYLMSYCDNVLMLLTNVCRIYFLNGIIDILEDCTKNFNGAYVQVLERVFAIYHHHTYLNNSVNYAK